MRRGATGARRAAYGVGLGCGLVAGMVGVGQWALTARDLDERYAAYQAMLRRSPDLLDATNVVMANQWYWLGTAAWASVATLVVYLLAAFTAAWASQRRRDGVVAAGVAAAVSGAMYVAATLVVLVTGPAPFVIEGILPCEVPAGLAFVGGALLLARAAARLGTRAGTTFSRGRQAF